MVGNGIALSGALVLVGCGKMGGALLRGWLQSGIQGDQVHVVEPTPVGLDDVVAKGVRIVGRPEDLPANLAPAVVLLAIKPQFMDEALPAFARFANPQSVFLSIAAGKTIAYLRRKLGRGSQIVRAMPNTPASVGRGMSVIVRDPEVPGALRELCANLLQVVGKIAWVDREDDINVVTALSGGGPAYVFLLIEAMAEAGRKQGLDPDFAMTLARETVCGAGELAYRSSDSAAAMRQAVTSPKGTTLEALKILMAEGGLQALMDKAIEAATRRSREIGETG